MRLEDVRLWPHQQAAVDFARDKRACLMNYGMGTGKTLAALKLAHECGAKAVLVVGPLAVLDDGWPTQIAQFAEGWRYHAAIKGNNAQRKEAAERFAHDCSVRGIPFVVAINYESVWGQPFADWVMRKPWDMIVADEIHRIKSASGKASRFMTRLGQRGHAKLLGLTGTPMPHSPLDVYGQFRFLDSDIFGTSYMAFKNRYAIMGGFQGRQVVAHRNLDDLRHRMDRITINAGRDVLNRPDPTDTDLHITLSPKGKRAYDGLERDFVAQLDEGEITAANGLVKLLRLQQLTGGHLTPDEKDEPVEVDTGKRDRLVELLKDVSDTEPVVVFCQFRADLDTVHKAAEAVKRESLELSGRRKELREWQQDGAPPILAVQIQSGGVGVNLTRARIGVYLSTGFSLGDYEQSRARIDRPGQDNPVAFFHLIARGTVDEKVRKALRDKASVVDSVISELRHHVGGQAQ